MRTLLVVALLAACDEGTSSGGADMSASACNPPCGAGTLCCSEPSHMITDAGAPGSYLTCAPPTTTGMCPQYP